MHNQSEETHQKKLTEFQSNGQDNQEEVIVYNDPKGASSKDAINAEISFYQYIAFTIWDIIFCILFGIYLSENHYYNPEDKSECNTFKFWSEVHYYLTIADIPVNACILISYKYSFKWFSISLISSYVYTVPYTVFLIGTYVTMRSSCGHLFYLVIAEIISIILFIIGCAFFSHYMKKKLQQKYTSPQFQ